MRIKNLFCLGGIASIVSGFCIIIGKFLLFTSYHHEGEIFDFFSPMFGLFAVLGIYFWHREKAGRLGDIAFMIMFTGLSLVLCLDYFGAFILPYLPDTTVTELMNKPSSIYYAISGLLFLVGEILFGISIIKARVFSRIATFLFMLGFIPVPLTDVFPIWVVSFGSVLAGIGLSWLGTSLCMFSLNDTKN